MTVSAPPRPSRGPVGRSPLPAAPGTPDVALVALAADGDAGAFEALFRRHRADVLAYATRMLRDHGRAEDVVQDVFVSAMRAISGASPAAQPTHVRAWLREIARRACIDQWRGTTRRGEVSLDAPDGLRSGDARRLSDDESLARATDDREAVAALRLAFGDLPELQHAILVQRELEGRSIPEIAARLGLTTTVVEGQLARGRRALGRSYRELQSGERCVAIRALCEASLGGRLGVRDRHRLGRHVRGCDACRRHAHERGVDARILAGPLVAPAAAFLPFPLLRRLAVDHPLTGDAAGGLLGAKVLVGAAVIAAGGGGMYAARTTTPLSNPTRSAPARAAGADLGLRAGPGGPVLRIPGAGAFAATAVLPARGSGSGAGTRVAGPYRPPWLPDPDAATVAPGVGASGLAALPPSATGAVPVPAPAAAAPAAGGSSRGPAPSGSASSSSASASSSASPARDAVSPGAASSSSSSSSSTAVAPALAPPATGGGDATPAAQGSAAEAPAAAPEPAPQAPADQSPAPEPAASAEPAQETAPAPEDEAPTEAVAQATAAVMGPLAASTTAAPDGGTADGD